MSDKNVRITVIPFGIDKEPLYKVIQLENIILDCLRIGTILKESEVQGMINDVRMVLRALELEGFVLKNRDVIKYFNDNFGKDTKSEGLK